MSENETQPQADREIGGPLTPTGRPLALTPEVQETIVNAIKLDATYKLAAAYAGITYQTFNNWMKRGRAEAERRENPRIKENTRKWEKEDIFFDFFYAVKNAEAIAAVNNLANIEAAARSGHWQASAWKLERRHGYRQNIDMTSDGEKIEPAAITYIKEDRSLDREAGE